MHNDSMSAANNDVPPLHALISAANTPGADDFGRPYRIRQALVALNKEAMLDAMAAVGASLVTAEYAGSGDSGEGVDVTTEPADISGTVLMNILTSSFDHERKLWVYSAAVKEMSLIDAAEMLCDDLISAAGHDGFENNDGGGGTMTLTLASRELELEHYDCYVERETSVHTF